MGTDNVLKGNCALQFLFSIRSFDYTATSSKSKPILYLNVVYISMRNASLGQEVTGCSKSSSINHFLFSLHIFGKPGSDWLKAIQVKG